MVGEELADSVGGRIGGKPVRFAAGPRRRAGRALLQAAYAMGRPGGERESAGGIRFGWCGLRGNFSFSWDIEPVSHLAVARCVIISSTGSSTGVKLEIKKTYHHVRSQFNSKDMSCLGCHHANALLNAVRPCLTLSFNTI